MATKWEVMMIDAAEVMDALAATGYVTRTRWYPFDHRGAFKMADGHEYVMSVEEHGIMLEDDVSMRSFSDVSSLIQWARGYNTAYINAVRRESK